MRGINARTVEEYLAQTPEPARGTLEKLRATIRAAVPPGTEELIMYRMPMFKYKGMLVGYAAHRNHCGFYVTSGTLLQAFEDELKGYSTSAGTVRFPMDKPLPSALVKRLVKARVAEQDREPPAARKAARSK
jgi:uncharacterized protein YdhG (YjbR/CyaY superfamily)